MTNLDTLDRAMGRRLNVSPLWWRIPVWAALTVASVVQTDGVGHRIATAVLMTIAVSALQLVQFDNVTARRAAILICTIAGLAACLTAPNGIAEPLPLIAAMRAPKAFGGMALGWFTALVTLAFGATIGYISASFPGVLAGTAIPLLVQRQLEHEELVRERDRAQALLVEVQNAREAETQAAALRERARIAREMHDVLAHSLAGLSVQLQGVRAVATKEGVGAVVLGPLDKAAALARDGLAEARGVVSALRDPAGLGLDALAALVARHPGNATLESTGEPGEVSADAGHAVYRAVQEALTNAIRHAPGSAVTVRLDWEVRALHVIVADDGPAPGRSAVAGQGTGLGLAGMSERVEQVGGTVRAGPHERGWRVAITVPAEAST